MIIENSKFLNAVEKGNFDAAIDAIEAGADINAIDDYTKANALHIAIQQNNYDMFEWLLEITQKGTPINIEARTLNGVTPLLFALSDERNDKYIKALIEKGADVNALYPDDVSPIAKTIIDNKREYTKLLLENNKLDLSKKTGTPLLLLAVSNLENEEDYLNIKKMLELGIDINSVNSSNNNALMILLERIGLDKANKEIRNYEEKISSKIALVHELIDKGIDITLVNDRGVDVLALAAIYNNAEITLKVLKTGKVNLKNIKRTKFSEGFELEKFLIQLQDPFFNWLSIDLLKEHIKRDENSGNEEGGLAQLLRKLHNSGAAIMDASGNKMKKAEDDNLTNDVDSIDESTVKEILSLFIESGQDVFSVNTSNNAYVMNIALKDLSMMGYMFDNGYLHKDLSYNFKVDYAKNFKKFMRLPFLSAVMAEHTRVSTDTLKELVEKYNVDYKCEDLKDISVRPLNIAALASSDKVFEYLLELNYGKGEYTNEIDKAMGENSISKLILKRNHIEARLTEIMIKRQAVVINIKENIESLNKQEVAANESLGSTELSDKERESLEQKIEKIKQKREQFEDKLPGCESSANSSYKELEEEYKMKMKKLKTLESMGFDVQKAIDENYLIFDISNEYVLNEISNEYNVDLNKKNEKSDSLMFTYLKNNRIDLVVELLDNENYDSSDILLEVAYGESKIAYNNLIKLNPLKEKRERKVTNKGEEVVENYYVIKDTYIDKKDPEGNNALIIAIANNNKEMFQFIFNTVDADKRSEIINTVNINNENALIRALGVKNYNMTNNVINYVDDASLKTVTGIDALSLSKEFGLLELTEKIENRIIMNKKSKQHNKLKP